MNPAAVTRRPICKWVSIGKKCVNNEKTPQWNPKSSICRTLSIPNFLSTGSYNTKQKNAKIIRNYINVKVQLSRKWISLEGTSTCFVFARLTSQHLQWLLINISTWKTVKWTRESNSWFLIVIFIFFFLSFCSQNAVISNFLVKRMERFFIMILNYIN